MSSYSTKPNAPDGSYPDEKNKQWQREFLMERLRSHYAQHKTFPELSKAMRMSMLEKRYALDAVEKSNLQKCLDSMQHCIKVTTRQGLIERLDSLSRQLGLKFMEDASGLFIYSDMFFLEIILDPNDGKLKDVKVHHECKIEQQSCSELVTCLINGDFADFTNQLEGLSSIYQLNAEPKVKSKAFVALQAMEMDLYNLFKWKSFNKDIASLLIDSPVGLAQKRRGGHPMKLTYFISPYDLLNLDNKSITPLTLEYIKSKDIGMSVTVNLESSSTNILQILPSVTFSKESNFPCYSQLNQSNSTFLPATFVLKLNKPLPVSDALLSVIGMPPKISNTQYLINLAVQVASKGSIKNVGKGLFVALPDQNHCYYITENRRLTGSIISNVPYTEPSQVPKILSALKQQALFFSLLSSCIRIGEKNCNLESTIILEINVLSIYKIAVALQHPYDESMVSVEFNLSDIGNIKVQIYSLSNNYESTNRKLTKIIQTSLSIPITIRYLLKLWNHEHLKGFNRNSQENGNFDSNTMEHLNSQINRITGVGGSSSLMGNEFQTNKISKNGGGGGLSELNPQYSQEQNRQFFHSVNSGSNLNLISNESNSMGVRSTNSMTVNSVGCASVNHFNLKSDNIKISINQEDFCESPKSENQIKTSDLNAKVLKFSKEAKNLQILNSDNSLGGNESLNSKVTVTKSLSGNALTIEKINATGNNNSNNNGKKILDKVASSETWKKPVGNDSKNSVSITPVLPNNATNDSTNMGNISSVSSVCSVPKNNKKSVIEIIPIKSNAVNNSISITPIQSKNLQGLNETSKNLFQSFTSNVNLSTNLSSKKKVDEKESLKVEKKRRKKDSSSNHLNNNKAFDNIELKIIEITGDGNTSTFTRKVDSSKSSNNLQKKNASSNIHISNSQGSSSSSSSKKISTKLYSNNSGISSKNPLLLGSSSSSPKNKHNMTSGKPSLTTLKSATNSYANISDSKESFSLIKLSQIADPNLQNSFDIFQDNEENDVFDFATSSDYTSSLTSPQSRVRKNSLTAVIDKLNKQVKNCITDEIGEKLEKMHKEVNSLAIKNTVIEDINSKSNEEYMIKPSLDGMKLTINKTKSDSSHRREKSSELPRSGNSSPNIKKHFGTISCGSNSNPGSSSPKKHTGLKPGVSSGPASKKSLEKFQNAKSRNTGLSKSNSSDCLTARPSINSITKPNILSKSLSSNSLSSDSSTSSISSSSSARKDKSYNSKNKMNVNISNSSNRVINEQDPTTMKLFHFSSNKNIMEGFIKSLDTNFQIPKLSQKIVSPSASATTNLLGADINSKHLSVSTTHNAVGNISVENNSSKRNNGQDSVKILANNINNVTFAKGANVSFPKFEDKLLKNIPIEKKQNLDSKTAMNVSLVNNIAPKLVTKTIKVQQKSQQNFSDMFTKNIHKSSQMSSTTLFNKMQQNFPETSTAVSVRLLNSTVPSPPTVGIPLTSNAKVTNSPTEDDEIMDEGLLGVSTK